MHGMQGSNTLGMILIVDFGPGGGGHIRMDYYYYAYMDMYPRRALELRTNGRGWFISLY